MANSPLFRKPPATAEYLEGLPTSRRPALQAAGVSTHGLSGAGARRLPIADFATTAPHRLARASGPLAFPEVTNDRWVQVAFVATDIVLVLLNVVLAWHLRLAWVHGIAPAKRVAQFLESSLPPQYFGFLLLYAALVALFCHTQGLYAKARDGSKWDESLAVAKAVFLSTVLLTAFIYASGLATISRLVVWSSAILNVLTLTAWRFRKRQAIEQRMAAGIGTKNVLIVGAGKVGREVANYLERHRQLGLVVKGFLDHRGIVDGDPTILGTVEDLPAIARAHFVDEIIVSITSAPRVVRKVILAAKRSNLEIKIVPDLYGAHDRGAKLHYLGDIPVMSLCSEPVAGLGRLAKRMLDVIGALFGLVALSPVLLLIAGLIKSDSRGPAFYRCPRVGKKGKTFVCLKFRTMVANADLLKASLRHLNEREAVTFKIAHDPRITRVGRILRKYSLDELPQLWNVFVGDMSLVGPRPHPLDDYKQYALEHLRRLDISPGITGLWQVTARHDPSFDRNIALDLEYIENWSLWMDLSILLRTLPAVVLGKGA